MQRAAEELHQPGVEKAVLQHAVERKDLAVRRLSAQVVGRRADRLAAMEEIDPLRQLRSRGVAHEEDEQRHEHARCSDPGGTRPERWNAHRRERGDAGDDDHDRAGVRGRNPDQSRQRQRDERDRAGGDPAEYLFRVAAEVQFDHARTEQGHRPEEREKQRDEDALEEQRRDVSEAMTDDDVVKDHPRRGFREEEAVVRVQLPAEHPPQPAAAHCIEPQPCPAVRDRERQQKNPADLASGQVEER